MSFIQSTSPVRSNHVFQIHYDWVICFSFCPKCRFSSDAAWWNLVAQCCLSHSFSVFFLPNQLKSSGKLLPAAKAFSNFSKCTTLFQWCKRRKNVVPRHIEMDPHHVWWPLNKPWLNGLLLYSSCDDQSNGRAGLLIEYSVRSFCNKVSNFSLFYKISGVGNKRVSLRKCSVDFSFQFAQ